MKTLPVFILIAGALGLPAAGPQHPRTPYDDPVSQFAERLAHGEITLRRDSDRHFLEDVLASLQIPVASQMLVFSKSSQQNSRITPQTPRAIYFSDDIYLAWVQHGVIELIAHDSAVGPLFSILDRATDLPTPRLTYSENCLSCHEGSRTRNVPGMQVRSLFTDTKGIPQLSGGSYLSEHDSPLSERWGGWYVTGTHGDARHMGNVFATFVDGAPTLDREAGANLTSLQGLFDTAPYLRDDSDIVALMVLEHQVGMHNRITEAQQYFQNALKYQFALYKDAPPPLVEADLKGSAASVAKTYAAKVVSYMLFEDEATLPQGGIEGGPDFQEAFRTNAREVEGAGSLKDFQLLDRLFKNRCSYMIYSRAFTSLHPALKDAIYRQLHAALTMADDALPTPHLGQSERRRILTILRETLPNLPAYWHPETN